MPTSVNRLCRAYVNIVRRMQHTTDSWELEDLEYQRSECHARLMRALNQIGMRMGRQDSEDFAFEVAG